MSTLIEAPFWWTGINKVEQGELIEGGDTGLANLATRQLADRSLFLKEAVEVLEGIVGGGGNPIDADTLEGHPASDFSLTDHIHDLAIPLGQLEAKNGFLSAEDKQIIDNIPTTYSPLTHNHDGVYVPIIHANTLDIHRTINDSGTSTTDLWSASKIQNENGLINSTISSHLNNQNVHQTQWIYANGPGSFLMIMSSTGVFADTSTNAWSIVLKPSPTIGDMIEVSDIAQSWGTNNLTIERNGQLINGLAEDLICDSTNCCFKMVYCNSTYGWKVM